MDGLIRDSDRGLCGMHGHIVESLGRRIVNGLIAAGEPLPSEADLLEQFDASRTVLREALRVLAAKGLVETRQRSGTRVRGAGAWSLLDPDVMSWLEVRSLTPELRDVLQEFRQIFEPAAARLAARRATQEHRATLVAALGKMEAAEGDPQAYFKADLQFHNQLFAATGNPFLVSLGHAVEALLGFAFSLQQHSLIRRDIGVGLHRNLLVAIELDDPDGAEAAMLAIINRAGTELDTFLCAAGAQGRSCP